MPEPCPDPAVPVAVTGAPELVWRHTVEYVDYTEGKTAKLLAACLDRMEDDGRELVALTEISLVGYTVISRKMQLRPPRK